MIPILCLSLSLLIADDRPEPKPGDTFSVGLDPFNTGGGSMGWAKTGKTSLLGGWVMELDGTISFTRLLVVNPTTGRLVKRFKNLIQDNAGGGPQSTPDRVRIRVKKQINRFAKKRKMRFGHSAAFKGGSVVLAPLAVTLFVDKKRHVLVAQPKGGSPIDVIDLKKPYTKRCLHTWKYRGRLHTAKPVSAEYPVTKDVIAVNLIQQCLADEYDDRPADDPEEAGIRVDSFRAIPIPPVITVPQCPKQAKCPPHYGNIFSTLGRLCSGKADRTDLRRLKWDARNGVLSRSDALVLFNAVGAMRGYSFNKAKGLNAFFYGKGANSWLPRNCHAAFGKGKKAPRASLKLVPALKKLWRSIR